MVVARRPRRVTEAAEGSEVEVILDRTPAYAESGGQIGDTGTLVGRTGRGEIVDTYHRGVQADRAPRAGRRTGGFREGEDVAVTVESPRREGLRQHHTGTHLLHAALRKVLGTHVGAGGLAGRARPPALRLLARRAACTDREVEQIEELVNEQVAGQRRASTREEMDLDEALRAGRDGALRREVRRPRAGDQDRRLLDGAVRRHAPRRDRASSACSRSSTEGAVAAGVRRIEAVAGHGGARGGRAPRARAARSGGAPQDRAARGPAAARKLLDEQKRLERQLAELEARLARLARRRPGRRRASGRTASRSSPARVDGLDRRGAAGGRRSAARSARLRRRLRGQRRRRQGEPRRRGHEGPHEAVPGGQAHPGSARAAGGSGGGRPDLAQAGAKDPGRLDEALALVEDFVRRTAG